MIEQMTWRPIETAPEGRCLMWVADGGERGRGGISFGRVFIYEDSRAYRPDGHTGEWNVTHWMPVPDGTDGGVK